MGRVTSGARDTNTSSGGGGGEVKSTLLCEKKNIPDPKKVGGEKREDKRGLPNGPEAQKGQTSPSMKGNKNCFLEKGAAIREIQKKLAQL